MTRQRSPNYPNLSLSDALARVRKVFDLDRQAPLDRAVVAKHMGYGGTSGASDKTIGSIMQYGLLEKVGKGEIRVSQLAVDIFHPLDEQQKRRALSQAGLRPDIFQDLFTRFGGVAPSEDAARSYLIRQDFLDRAIGPVISAFAETLQYLKQEGANESDGAPSPMNEESTHQPIEGRLDATLGNVKLEARGLVVGGNRNLDQRILTKGMLSKASTFEIIVSGQIGLKELDMLIRKLELDKEILAEAADDGQD